MVGSYRISNAIPTLKWDKLEGASTREVLQAMLGLQGRARWAYPVSGPEAASWGANPPPERVALDREFLEYYFPELDRRTAQWRAGQLDESIAWPLTAAETREQ